MKLLGPDMDMIAANTKRYQQQGDKEAAKIENNKRRSLMKNHGIRPFISAFNIF
jgi:hypothetical protein|tara:strand:+ start:750 stop:911 length:162 start_codon:yes stop_codon:yes gene_type:complete